MGPLFLHGGGANPAALAGTLGRFISSARAGGDGPILLIAHADVESDVADYRDMLAAAGESQRDLAALVVSSADPPTVSRLVAHRPAAIFVCGGPTPRYHEVLCADTSWLGYVRDGGLPFGDTSAGAAVAAEHAIVGGWRVRRGDVTAVIVYPGASEGLELLGVRPGLGLIPGSIEVHASQSGTLARLLHAVDTGQTPGGWAIDEDTLLEVAADHIGVWGLVQVYRVRRRVDGEIAVEIIPAGTVIAQGE